MSNNDPLLVDTGKGLSVTYKNKNLYSKYNPINSPLRLINSVVWQEKTIYLVPSPLLGYGVEDLLDKLPESSLIIFIELDPKLFDISVNKKSIKLISKSFDFIANLHSLNFSLYKKCDLIRLNGSYDLYKNNYNRLFNLLLTSLHNFWKNRYTSTRLGQLWIKNTLTNLKYLDLDLPLSNLKTEKPVFIVGAGESLEQSLNIIKNSRSKIFLLCVDTALQVLLEYGLKPDAVIALEAQYYNLPDFYGAKGMDIDLIYDLSSYPGVIENLKGNRYYTVTKFSNSRLLEKLKDSGVITDMIPPLGSVGITAIFIALKITNSNIFVTGLDFSYKIGKTHSRGTPYHMTSLIESSRVISLDSTGNCLKRPLTIRDDKNGNKIQSDDILYDYSLQTKELLEGLDSIYDISSSGMEIGLPRITIDEYYKLLVKSPLKNTAPLKTIKLMSASEFLLKELDFLKDTIKTLNIEINNPSSMSDVKVQLENIKYYFEHFPEEEPLSLLTRHNLTRYYYTLIRFNRLISGSKF